MNKKILLKSAIVSKIAEQNQKVSDDAIRKAVDVFFDSLIAALVSGDRVELRKFCSLSVKVRGEKVVRNPRTGSYTLSEPKGSVQVRLSKEVKVVLNRGTVSGSESDIKHDSSAISKK